MTYEAWVQPDELTDGAFSSEVHAYFGDNAYVESWHHVRGAWLHCTVLQELGEHTMIQIYGVGVPTPVIVPHHTVQRHITYPFARNYRLNTAEATYGPENVDANGSPVQEDV